MCRPSELYPQCRITVQCSKAIDHRKAKALAGSIINKSPRARFYGIDMSRTTYLTITLYEVHPHADDGCSEAIEQAVREWLGNDASVTITNQNHMMMG